MDHFTAPILHKHPLFMNSKNTLHQIYVSYLGYIFNRHISESIYNILYNEKLISNQNCKTSLNMRKCFAKNIHPVARACCSIDQTRSEIHFEWGKPLKI